MKIYGHPMSTCTRKVLMTLAENNLKADFETIDLFTGAQKAPSFLAHQPFGQVPALDDDGFMLYESRAICRYLNEKANGPLIPRDLKERARMEQWISVETSNFTAPVMKFIFHYVFKREQPADALATAGQQLDTALGVMERELTSQPFLAGSHFSLADVCFMPYIEYAMTTPAKEHFAKFPHVTAWWNKVSERPTWKTATGRA